MTTSALEALEHLQAGNSRFVSDIRQSTTSRGQARRDELVSGQSPSAVILGCSDSRVPAEIIFGQGLGDLFVIRVAGNIVAASQIGSIEYAVEMFGTQLVVVLGHSSCGAVSATLQQLDRPSESQSPNLRSIVDHIRPAIETLTEVEGLRQSDTLLKHAVRANIRASANQLRHGSQLLEQRVQRGELLVVGAEYSLETGLVEFFDGLPKPELSQ